MLENVANYLLLISPAIISIFSSIAAIMVAINRVKNISRNSEAQLKLNRKDREMIQVKMGDVLRENVELKKDLDKIIKRLEETEAKENEKK